MERLQDGPHWLPAWAAASALLLALQFGLGLGFPLALLGGLLLGVALTLVLRPRALAERVAGGSRGDVVRKLIAEAEPELARLHGVAAALGDRALGERFARIGAVTGQVMQALAADPARIGQGQRLLTYLLPRAVQLAEGLRLVEAQAHPDPERRRRMVEVSAQLERAVARTRDNLAEPDLRALDVELKLLEAALGEAEATGPRR
jgi:GNAT superfamily N-acetyltransferase